MPFLLANQQRHCKLKENLDKNVEPMQLVVQNGRTIPTVNEARDDGVL